MLLPSVTFESCVIINRHVKDKLQGFLDAEINLLDIYRGFSSILRHDQQNVTSTNYKVFSMLLVTLVRNLRQNMEFLKKCTKIYQKHKLLKASGVLSDRLKKGLMAALCRH